MRSQKLKSVFCVLLFLFYSEYIQAGQLNESKTVFLIEDVLAGLDIYQKLYFQKDGSVLLVREQNLLLPLADWLELGFYIPWVNYLRNSGTQQSQVGDVKIDLNFATKWLEDFLNINWLVEYNVGSGPKYNDENNNPMSSYGFPEWRTGPILFKKHRYFSWHFNLFYVFRGHDSGEKREFTLLDKFYGNIFNVEHYKRGLGFAFKHEAAFFYYKNLRNDNLEYIFAVNTELAYPFVPFLEFTFSHDFQGGETKEIYERRGPGSGYFRAQAAIGGKLFFAEDHFCVKFSIFVPIGNLSDIYVAGMGLGLRIDF